MDTSTESSFDVSSAVAPVEGGLSNFEVGEAFSGGFDFWAILLNLSEVLLGLTELLLEGWFSGKGESE